MTLQISFPAAKCWPNSSSKILPELQLQNLDQTLYSKSEQMFSFITKPQLPNMQQTVANMILIINISNSNNLNNFWLGIYVERKGILQPVRHGWLVNDDFPLSLPSLKMSWKGYTFFSILKSHKVSWSVSQWVSDKVRQWPDSSLLNRSQLVSQWVTSIANDRTRVR